MSDALDRIIKINDERRKKTDEFFDTQRLYSDTTFSDEYIEMVEESMFVSGVDISRAIGTIWDIAMEIDEVTNHG